MSEAPTLKCQWTPEGFRPANRIVAQRAAESLRPGDYYFVTYEHERSQKTHKHQFAWVREAWKTLPEHLEQEFASPDHLRKWALIQAGYYDEKIIDVGTKAGAERVAAFVRGDDEFAHVVARGGVVVVRKAQSQSVAAMGARQFQASKSAILDIISNLLEVEPEVLLQRGAA